MRQFIDPRRQVPSWIRDYYKDHAELNKTRTTDGLMACLTTHLATSLSKVFLLVDAFDECDPVVQRKLLSFTLSLPPNVRIMLMSRPIQEVDAASWSTYPIRTTEDDMEKYIQQRLDDSAYAATALDEPSHATPSLTRENLMKQVVSHANGM